MHVSDAKSLQLNIATSLNKLDIGMQKDDLTSATIMSATLFMI